MKLKKLEIIGFKSFRDRTVLEFPDGVSAVVGPNGCGKSNVVDAIRWVLGEQRVTMLRGKKMEDVIFNGSDDAAPVGMAEVTMVLEKGRYTFPGAYADCAEVMITRKLFRGGDSEYCINNVPCRLLDVREFFMDTGVGARTYSMVEQGSIASLVEAKPEDRRMFIEEAAGIAKYKSRKESALRKMESTKANVTRLNDILREVKTQLNQLSRQARRAERYKALRGEIKDAEIRLCLQGRMELTEKRDALKKAHGDADARATDARTKLAEADAAILSLRTELQSSEEVLSKLQEKIYGHRNEIGIREKSVEFSKNRIVELEARARKNREDIVALEDRKTAVEAEILAAREAAGEAQQNIEAIRGAIEERIREAEELKGREGALRKDLDERRVQYFDIQTEKARLKNMLSTLGKSVEDIRRRAGKDGQDLEENEARSRAIDDQLRAVRGEIETGEGELETLQADEVTALAGIARSSEALEELDGVIEGLKEEMGRKSSRLASLKEFQNGYEWCSDGIRNVLRAREGGGFDTEAFYGLVADHIDVPEEYEVAVEAVLGEKLQYIIVKSQEEGIQAIDYLKTATAGRGSFVPLRVKSRSEDYSSKDYLRDTVRLIDVVNVRDDFRSIADYLLGDIVLVPSLKVGVSLWQRNGFRGTFVTPDGDTISPHGVLTGGSRAVTEETSLLRKKREITALEADVSGLADNLAEEVQRRSRLASRVEESQQALDGLRARIRELELQVNSKRKDVERFEGEMKWVAQRIASIRFGLDSARSEEKELLEKIVSVEQEVAAQEARSEESGTAILRLQQDWEDAKKAVEEKERRLTDERVTLASLEEKRSAGLKAISNLEVLLGGIADEDAGRKNDLEVCARASEEVTAAVGRDETALEELYEVLGAAERESSVARDAHEASVGALAARDNDARDLKRSLDEVTKEASELDIRVREASFEIDALKAKVLEKYAADLDALAADFTPLDAESLEALRARLEKGREQVESFGEVNLLAIGEHDELQQRHDFLVSQIADLEASLETLQRTIARINQISKTRFSETFEAVNECFKLIFPKLFRGGRGTLKLTDSEDMLETGVDIEIQLPGKRLQSISLLSGGEKALAAVALIFAIILFRPTPFLVLDEVDAALDDANISLFNQFLREVSEKSQIVLVTHNKRTMEVAVNLYGVSMERKGISNLVSVNLR